MKINKEWFLFKKYENEKCNDYYTIKKLISSNERTDEKLNFIFYLS